MAKTANYYDDKYRVIQTVSDNYKGGSDRVSSVYDFVGKILKTKTTHSQYDVAWKNVVGAAVSGNKLYRTINSTTGWNQSGAVSVQQLPATTNGWIEVTASEATSASRMIGLAATNPDLGFQNINYTLYFNGTQLYFYESGQSTAYGTFQTGEVYRIERVGTTVKYYKNGTLIRTSPTASSSMLMVDATFYNYGSMLMDVNASFAASINTTTRTFEYDHAGRLLKTYHKINNDDEVLLSQNEYNELGQLVDKDLHSVNGSLPKQSVDFRYNIRGWLTSINNATVANDLTNDDNNDLFGMNLAYNDNVLSGGTPQYNGNIASMTWSKNLGLDSVKQNGYHYSYDPMNRITAAAFKAKSFSWAVPAANAFSESGYTYDLNGNIKALTRYDHRGSTTVMDNLEYHYGTGTNQSNKLLRVTDAGDGQAGFKEFNSSNTDDYAYDANGNLLWDKNKGGQELLINGSFDTGNSSWIVSDASSKLTFSNGSVNIVSGSSTATLTQSSILRAAYPYVVVIDLERTSGSAVTVTAGNVSASVSTTGVYAFNLTPGSGSSFYITIPANFVGKINKVELKGLVVISYNHLNLVSSVTAANDKQLIYTYDATGRKLSQDVLDMNMPAAGGITSEKSSHYSGEFFYENDTLKFINTEEGRVIMTGATPEYQYHLKDHLGNVRLTFTTKDDVENDTATYETNHLAQDQSKFLRVENARRVMSSLFDRTNDNSDGFSQRLSGRENEKFGLSRSLSVMPGDTISVEVFAKYVDPGATNAQPLTDFISALVAGTLPAGTVIDGAAFGASTSSFPFAQFSQLNQEDEDVPVAGFTWLIFDRDHQPKDGGFVSLSDAAAEDGSDVDHERLYRDIAIKEPGYVYIYLSNENETPVEVFFDDFSVEHKKSPVVQMDDYYAFGLRYNSFKRENSVLNKAILFQGQEHIDDLGLNWDSFQWRNHQPDIGRFFNVDPLADKYVYNSPYAFAENKLGRGVELEGLELGGFPYTFFARPTPVVRPVVRPVVETVIRAGGSGRTRGTTLKNAARVGRETHKEVLTRWRSEEGFDTEVKMGEGNQLDGLKIERNQDGTSTGRVRELKPNTPSGKNRGMKQLDRYIDAASKRHPEVNDWQPELTLYQMLAPTTNVESSQSETVENSEGPETETGILKLPKSIPAKPDATRVAPPLDVSKPKIECGDGVFNICG